MTGNTTPDFDSLTVDGLITGYVTATGATASQALANRFPRISPKDFGAVGDGATNDAVAVQAAYSRAGAVGGTVILDATYAIATGILAQPTTTLPAPLTGANLHFSALHMIHTISENGGGLKAIGAMSAMLTYIFNAGLGSLAPFYAKTEGVTFDGNGLATTAIVSNFCMHNTYHRNRISGVTTGIEVIGYGVVDARANTIMAATCIQLGISATPGGGDSLIQRNDFYPTNGSGEAVGVEIGAFGGDTTVTSNTITRVLGAGVGSTVGVRLSGDRCASGAVTASNFVVSNNEFYGCDYGVLGRGLGTGNSLNVWNGVITANHCDGSPGTGVLADLLYCDDIIISANFMNGKHLPVVAGPGLQLNQCSRIQVIGNNASNYNNSFVLLYDTIDCDFQGNVVTDVGQSGAGFAVVNMYQQVGAPVRNVFRGNHFYQSSASYAQNGLFEHAGLDFTYATDNLFTGIVTPYTIVGANSQMGTGPGVFTTLAVTQLNLTTGAGPSLRSGTGAASGTQPKGSLWMRTDGGVGTTMYVSQGAGTWNPVAGV